MRSSFALMTTLFLLILALAACQGATDGDLPLAPTPAEGDIFPRVTVTPGETLQEDSSEAQPEGYPAPPTMTATPEGYPPPPTPAPTLDAYPAGGFAWVIRPVGVQCEDPEENEYADLQEAVAALASAGVPARSSGMTELAVCAACGCPTSAFYRVEIEAANVDKAVALGWVPEEE